MKTFFVAVRAILYASGFVLFWGWLASGARRYDARMGFELPSWSGGVGVLLVIAGGLLVLACIWNFIVRGRGTPAPFDPPTVFVATGPYRYVRNPMYIGAAIFLAGYGLFTRSVSIALLPLPLRSPRMPSFCSSRNPGSRGGSARVIASISRASIAGSRVSPPGDR